MHSKMLLLPGADEEPDGHSVHDVPSDDSPPKLYVPASQAVHAAVPSVVLYVPAAHAVQARTDQISPKSLICTWSLVRLYTTFISELPTTP